MFQCNFLYSLIFWLRIQNIHVNITNKMINIVKICKLRSAIHDVEGGFL